MPNEPIGSPGADADRNRAEGGSWAEITADQSSLSSVSPGAAADRNRAKKREPGKSVVEQFDDLSPGTTAEIEADSS